MGILLRVPLQIGIAIFARRVTCNYANSPFNLILISLSRWYRVPQREMDRRNGDRSEPLHTPAMAGGLFSIDRDYFYEVNLVDYKTTTTTTPAPLLRKILYFDNVLLLKWKKHLIILLSIQKYVELFRNTLNCSEIC